MMKVLLPFLTFLLLSISMEGRQSSDSSAYKMLSKLHNQFDARFNALPKGETLKWKALRKATIKKGDPIADKLIAFLTFNGKPDLKQYQFFPFGVAEKEGVRIYYLLRVPKDKSDKEIDLISYEEMSFQGDRMYLFGCREFRWKEDMLVIGRKDRLSVMDDEFHKFSKKDQEGARKKIKPMGRSLQDYLIGFVMGKKLLKDQLKKKN
ncbi:MAG: hypothetical protein AAFQ94_22860 [Bacteroidota bacterium]